VKPRGLFITKKGEAALDAVTEEEAPFVIRALASLEQRRLETDAFRTRSDDIRAELEQRRLEPRRSERVRRA
jgi:hypothetical protein